MRESQPLKYERILILGGAGLVGSHLCDKFLEFGSLVTVVDDLSSGSICNLNTNNEDLAFLELDIGDSAESHSGSSLDRLVSEHDLVYHLASPIGVGQAHGRGFDTTSSILKDGLNVVDCCLRNRTPILYTSSSEIYGAGRTQILSEDDTAGFGLEPRWGYGAAKMATEHLVAGLKRDFGIPSWVVRFFNVVGPRQNPKSGLVVSAFCKAAQEGGDIIVHGDGSDRRTFLHVEDAVDAIFAIPQAESLQGRSVNVGGTENISIKELAELVKELCGGGRIVFKDHDEVYGSNFVRVPDRRPNLDLLMNETGWKPSRTLAEAVAGCLDSMKNS